MRYIAKKQESSARINLLSPVQVVPAYWAALTLLTVLLYPGSALTIQGVVIALGFSLAFALGARLALGRIGADGSPVSDARPLPLSPSVLSRLVVVGACGPAVAAFLALRSNGFDLSQVASFAGLLESSNAISVARYSGQEYSSPLSSVLLGFGYAAGLVAPLAVGAGGPRFLVAVPIVASLVYSAVTTERLGLLVTLSFVVGGWLATRILSQGRVPRVSLRGVGLAVLVGGGLGAAFIAIAFLRIGVVDGGAAQDVLEKQRTYALGSLPALSEWVDLNSAGYASPLRDKDLGWGSASVAFVGASLGIDRLEYRAYDEFVAIDDSGHFSNVYTVFRGLILDFTVAGAVGVASLAGFVFGRLYVGAARARSSLAAVGTGAGYGAIMLSNTMSIFSFTNVVLAVAVALCMVKVASSRGGQFEDSGVGGRRLPGTRV